MYKSTTATVLSNGSHSKVFKITRGIRQGSTLSPLLFKLFLNDLLKKLTMCESGVCIGDVIHNCIAYADDLTLFALTATGLQRLINICYNYASLWRFSFGIAKTQCMIAGSNPFRTEPNWNLGTESLKVQKSLDILGLTYTDDGKACSHVEKRISKSRKAAFGLAHKGFSFPGLSTEAKAFLYNSVIQPTLFYGFDCLNLTGQDYKSIDSFQGSVIKRVCGLSKRSHHSFGGPRSRKSQVLSRKKAMLFI